MREIRIALLEADVALPTVKTFIEDVKKEALGQQVVKSVSPAQMIVKIVHDELVKLFGGTKAEIDFKHKPPLVILMAGLQAAGKTTSAAKLWHVLKIKIIKSFACEFDIYRPAAATQLKILADKINVTCDDFDEKLSVLQLAKSFCKKQKTWHLIFLILDSRKNSN